MTRRKMKVGDGAIPWALGLALVVGIGTVGHYAFSGDDPEESAASAGNLLGALTQNEVIATDTGEVRLTGPGQVSKQQGDMTYTFNFESRHVYVTAPQTASVLVSFEDFDNQDMITSIRRTGCEISGNMIAETTKFIQAGGVVGDESTLTQGTVASARIFTNQYCPLPARMPG